MTQVAEPILFELKFRKVCAKYQPAKTGDWSTETWGKPDEARQKSLPGRPRGFTPTVGLFPAIAQAADALNKTQMQSGFVDWFFYPEAAPAESDKDHCDTCRRLHDERGL